MNTQRPVGFSQVTAVVSRTSGLGGHDLEYRVVLSARLAAPHFGRLATPVPLAPEDSQRIDALADLNDSDLWADEIADLKKRYRGGPALTSPCIDLPLFSKVGFPQPIY